MPSSLVALLLEHLSVHLHAPSFPHRAGGGHRNATQSPPPPNNSIERRSASDASGEKPRSANTRKCVRQRRTERAGNNNWLVMALTRAAPLSPKLWPGGRRARVRQSHSIECAQRKLRRQSLAGQFWLAHQKLSRRSSAKPGERHTHTHAHMEWSECVCMSICWPAGTNETHIDKITSKLHG